MFKLRAGGGRLFRWLRAGPLKVGGATPRGCPKEERAGFGSRGEGGEERPGGIGWVGGGGRGEGRGAKGGSRGGLRP